MGEIGWRFMSLLERRRPARCWSRDLMVGVCCEALGFFCPAFADELAWREALECLEPLGEVVGSDKVGEMFTQLVVGFVVEAFDGRFLEGPIHSFDLAVIRHEDGGALRLG